MTQTPDTPPAAGAATSAKTSTRSKGGGLSGMLAADLKAMAQGMGIGGSGSMKKAQLVEAIKAAQAGEVSARAVQAPDRAPQKTRTDTRDAPADKVGEAPVREEQPAGEASRTQSQDLSKGQAQGQNQGQERQRTRTRSQQDKSQDKTQAQQPKQRDQSQDKAQQPKQKDQGQSQGKQNQGQSQQGQSQGKQNQAQQTQAQQTQQQTQAQSQDQQDGDDDGQGSRRNRRRRGRDRDRERRPNRNEPDTTVLEDDVLVPAAGILDVLDNYAFVRTSGYLPGTDDVYVSLSMVRRYGLRRGDAIVGQVRQPREGERKEKFNPMVRIDSVNGADPEAATDRPDFAKFTPLHSTDRLRMETTPTNLIGRMIDIAAPIGKGQRGLIVSPPKAGKTTVLQSIASSIAANNPECHLMVVLVDERPEEVTDFERSVKGEVIASTFDRPASDHTMVAELAIERAKRLVELGHDVVVLLDSITRLGRAYNLAAPASGRILSGGVDSSALYPPKRFFGAARNIEDGGSLTIIATALVETDSKVDEVIFEEFKGTGNMELRLRQEFADKRIFPAIDAVASGTRREEQLMGEEEQQIVWKLRRHLSSLDGEQALELLLERLKGSQNNIEFLTRVQKTPPTPPAK